MHFIQIQKNHSFSFLDAGLLLHFGVYWLKMYNPILLSSHGMTSSLTGHAHRKIGVGLDQEPILLLKSDIRNTKATKRKCTQHLQYTGLGKDFLNRAYLGPKIDKQNLIKPKISGKKHKNTNTKIKTNNSIKQRIRSGWSLGRKMLKIGYAENR